MYIALSTFPSAIRIGIGRQRRTLVSVSRLHVVLTVAAVSTALVVVRSATSRDFAGTFGPTFAAGLGDADRSRSSVPDEHAGAAGGFDFSELADDAAEGATVFFGRTAAADAAATGSAGDDACIQIAAYDIAGPRRDGILPTGSSSSSLLSGSKRFMLRAMCARFGEDES
ncbi:MAG TPA: hypothetical protein VJQ25_00090, partial [Nitrospira sp.]|nr:hypothetical protein [Nitrospira sp.]